MKGNEGATDAGCQCGQKKEKKVVFSHEPVFDMQAKGDCAGGQKGKQICKLSGQLPNPEAQYEQWQSERSATHTHARKHTARKGREQYIQKIHNFTVLRKICVLFADFRAIKPLFCQNIIFSPAKSISA